MSDDPKVTRQDIDLMKADINLVYRYIQDQTAFMNKRITDLEDKLRPDPIHKD